ncbi:MAG: hypothetical protein PHI97_21945 [Desulfobulbus sp.]|nr:hypothetical protein [Desulfobulbus sp.]
MKTIILYAIGVYLTFLCFGLYLNNVHGEETGQGVPSVPNQPSADKGYGFTPKEYVVPRIASTDAPLRHRNAKSCRQYLTSCEKSCSERGSLFKFQCIGQDFQPFDDHFHCTCADDLFARGDSSSLKTEWLKASKQDE